jgi:UDP-N-acetylglucosamine 2-epimerase (non-hydrolysing)
MRPSVFVIGTRAQLVKVAPVLRAAVDVGLPHVVWFTGQHRESVDDLIADFDLRSEFVMPGNHQERSSVRTLLGWLPKMFLDCYRFIDRQRQDSKTNPLVIVHGDTLSTLIGAIAGRMAKAEVVHLESGLSSGALFDPFPEELLRRLTFRCTRYALCPNPQAAERMRRFHGCTVVDTGENTLLDSVRFALSSSAERGAPSAIGYYIASIHRFQNIYRPARLSAIVADVVALSSIAPVYFVLHPATERKLVDTGLRSVLERASAVKLIPRMPYTDFLALLANALGVVSDGGSNQEELSYLGVPTVLYRDRTERPDGVGRNIVFEKDLSNPLAEFAASGGMDRLRIASSLRSEVFPSQHSARSIAGWAAART